VYALVYLRLLMMEECDSEVEIEFDLKVLEI